MGTVSRIEIEGFIDRMVGPKVEVDDQMLKICREKGEFGALSFGLLKEAIGLVGAVGSYLSGIRGRYQLTRDEAVCAGLVVRMFKLMMSIVKLSAGAEHGETVRVLSRCVLESSIDLRYLLQEGNEEELFDQFVMVGLRGERLLYEAVRANIESRGGETLAIEARMLASIETTCAKSGLSIEEVNPRAGNWGGGYRSRMQASGGAGRRLFRLCDWITVGAWQLVKLWWSIILIGTELGLKSIWATGRQTAAIWDRRRCARWKAPGLTWVDFLRLKMLSRSRRGWSI